MWRKVPGYPDRYEVNEKGEVRALSYETKALNHGKEGIRTVPTRMMKKGILNGKVVVHLYAGTCRADSRSRPRQVSRMVCLAFHGVPYRLHDPAAARRWGCRFKDEDVFNVRADNLEWVDRCSRDVELDAVAVLGRLFA